MNLAHIHLLLNHFPIIGTIIGLCLFLGALIGGSEDLEQAALLIFLGIALIAIPTYLSGSAAQSVLEKMPGISVAAIEMHRDAALLAYAFAEVTGAVAWFGLWQSRRNSRVGRGTLSTVLLLSLATVGLMANAGNLGGAIRHSEAMPSPDTPTIAKFVQPRLSLSADAIAKFVTGVKWVWPTLQTLHFMGLTLLMGVVFLVDLRVLGAAKSLSFASMHRLLPWGILGFGLNLLTGMCYFIAAPYQYTTNVTFYWKIALIMVAGVNAIYFTLFDEPWALESGATAPLKSKVMAASAIALWIGVMFCGLMLPFIGNAF
jgi:uncharacterized membrane protein